jgi:hypothetical protein
MLRNHKTTNKQFAQVGKIIGASNNNCFFTGVISEMQNGNAIFD